MTDYFNLLDGMDSLIDYVTGGAISKPLTDKSVIRMKHDEHVNKMIEEAIQESTLQEISDIGQEVEQEPTPVGMTCKVWTHGCALFDGIDLPNETLLYTAPPKSKQTLESGQKYWLCCGSTDIRHSYKCAEAAQGHVDRCRFGTAKEHSDWQLSLAKPEQAEKQEKLCKYCGGIGRVVCDGRCMPEQEPVVYQCPRCATSMEVDLSAKPLKREQDNPKLQLDAIERAYFHGKQQGIAESEAIAKLREHNT
jgi:hypothetical protein